MPSVCVCVFVHALIDKKEGYQRSYNERMHAKVLVATKNIYDCELLLLCLQSYSTAHQGI